MSFNVSNLFDNDDLVRIWPNQGEDEGPFLAYEWKRDLSIPPQYAMMAYYMSEMDIRRRQLICRLDRGGVRIQNGAMQMLVGDARAKTGIRGAGDIMRKFGRAMVTEENAIKPEYEGNGLLVCEPTWKHLVCSDLDYFGGEVVLDDGAFAACETSVRESTYMVKTISGALAGNEGLFKLKLSGHGRFVMESGCPESELITIDLENDELKLDGPLALAWSSSLDFTVERVTRTLIGSATSGEGLVNVYRGTGRIVMLPTQPISTIGLGD